MSDLTERLRDGCVCHEKRWSGDTHADLGGTVNEEATDAVMAEAADRIEALETALRDAERMVAAIVVSVGGKVTVPESVLTGSDWELVRTDDPVGRTVTFAARRVLDGEGGASDE